MTLHAINVSDSVKMNPSKKNVLTNVQRMLKALFNNVSTSKNLSCMTLHAINVSDSVKMNP